VGVYNFTPMAGYCVSCAYLSSLLWEAGWRQCCLFPQSSRSNSLVYWSGYRYWSKVLSRTVCLLAVSHQSRQCRMSDKTAINTLACQPWCLYVYDTTWLVPGEKFEIRSQLYRSTWPSLGPSPTSASSPGPQGSGWGWAADMRSEWLYIIWLFMQNHNI